MKSTPQHANPLASQVGRSMVWIALTLMLWVPNGSAQQSPIPYIGQNTGLGGFSYGPGIRLRSEENRGIKAGDFIFWPSLIIEGRWDSNVFQQTDCDSIDAQPGKECDEKPTDAPVMRIVPGFAFSNANPNKVAFQFGVESGARLYFSDVAQVKDQRNFDLKSDLKIDILPKGPVTVSIMDSFRRTLDTRNFSTKSNYNSNYNRAGAQVAIHPGGGALNVRLGYGYVFNFFDEFDKGEYQEHEFEFLTTWRFYPKTAAFLSATGSMKDWDSSDSSTVVLNDNKPLRVTAGLNGYFTKKIAALLSVGYGAAFYEKGPDFEHVIGQAEMTYKITPTILTAVGYRRNFSDSYYANYYGDDSVYLRANMRFARRVGLTLLGSFHFLRYAELDPVLNEDLDTKYKASVSQIERLDQALNLHAQVSVDITRWIGVSLGYELRAVFTDFVATYQALDGSGNPTGQFNSEYGQYIKHQVYGSINIRY